MNRINKKALVKYIGAYIEMSDWAQSEIKKCDRPTLNMGHSHPDTGMFILITYDVVNKKLSRIFYNEDQAHSDPAFDVEILF